MEQPNRESSIICFSETWLTPNINGRRVNIGGFIIVNSDRENEQVNRKAVVYVLIPMTDGPTTTAYTSRRLCAPQTSNFWPSALVHTASLEKSLMLS
ncbi:hypothetical protein ElyMa_004582100 [Elysia marginata]|uniref:Uncharacterized protein n=1 Tax=Elysia marginata TaxID=1093978 RepID=A0AAV4HV56_9GAST|nr:hypothetical protein ElyMa_004582100 [Elysia marginata]